MSQPSWHSDLETGLGALIAELEAAESTGLGKAPDWASLKAKAASIKAHVASALHEYTQQSGKLQNAAKYIGQLQGQLKEQAAAPMQPATGTGRPHGLGQSGQTVYLSAGATAGIAAGALLIGAVGGFATKAFIDASKEKKKVEEAKKAAAAVSKGEEGEE